MQTLKFVETESTKKLPKCRLECRPRNWKCGSPSWILHEFPAHRTELQMFHREWLAEITKEIVKSFEDYFPIRCMRLIGHAATWKYIEKEEYCRRSISRAIAAAEELSAQLSSFGLVTKIFCESDDLDLEDEIECCEPVSGIHVALIVGGRADNQPIKPNLIHRSDKTARDNRAINRRVEIYISRHNAENCQLGHIIEGIDLTTVTRNAEIIKRLKCLQKLIAKGVCGEQVDDRFWVFAGQNNFGIETECVIRKEPPFGEKHFPRVKPFRWHRVQPISLERNKNPLKIVELFENELGSSRKSSEIRKILVWLERVMSCNLDLLQEWVHKQCELAVGTFKKDPNCKFIGSAFKLAAQTKPPSVYKCYKPLLKELYLTCKEGCYR